MNHLDHALTRLFQAAKAAPAQVVSDAATEAPVGFATRLVAHWLAHGRPPAWLGSLRWGVACASLVLLLSAALHADLFVDEWAPTLAVLPSASDAALTE